MPVSHSMELIAVRTCKRFTAPLVVDVTRENSPTVIASLLRPNRRVRQGATRKATRFVK